jgi:hypothetical protein
MTVLQKYNIVFRNTITNTPSGQKYRKMQMIKIHLYLFLIIFSIILLIKKM